MKRYKNDGKEHHAYHSDSDQEGLCRPKRLIAVLIYLNDVEEGGETVFLNQAISVKPRCGRILMFPTSFSFVHAGRRPVSSYKVRRRITNVQSPFFLSISHNMYTASLAM